MRWSHLLLACLAFASACAHSPQCKQRINDCMRNCAPSPPAVDRGAEPGWYAGATTDTCERRCYGICSPTSERQTAPVEPAPGPTTK